MIKRIDTVEIKWFVGASKNCEKEKVMKFLSLLSEKMPYAIPKRYGETQPFKHCFSKENPQEFLTAWEAAANSFGMFSWVADGQPCHCGSMSMPPLRFEQNCNRKRCITFGITLDGHKISSMCESVVDAFVFIAKELEAFYGIAYVIRDVIVKKALGYDAQTEKSPLPRTQWWLGFPDKPVWMAWYGWPYKELLRSWLEGQSNVLDAGSGVMIQHGSLPQNMEHLHDKFRALPSEFLVKQVENMDLAHKVIDQAVDAVSLKKEKVGQVIVGKPQPAEILPELV